MPEQELEFDEALGSAAWARFGAVAEALPLEQVRAIRLDVRLGARDVLKVVRAIAGQGLGDDFKALPERFYAHESVEEVEALAWAVWHAYEQRLKEEATANRRTLPVELLDEATALRETMLRVVEYHLDDNADAVAEIASIRQGRGYLDTSSDLSRLAALYAEHAEALKGDTRRYKAEHAKDARRLAAAILTALGADQAASWRGRGARLWTLLLQRYEDIHAAAAFLYRRDPPRRALFPSAGRLGR